MTPIAATPSTASQPSSAAFSFPCLPPSCPNSAASCDALQALDCSQLPPAAPQFVSTTNPFHHETGSSQQLAAAAFLAQSAAFQRHSAPDFGSSAGLLRHSTWPKRGAEAQQPFAADGGLAARRTASGTFDITADIPEAVSQSAAGAHAGSSYASYGLQQLQAGVYLHPGGYAASAFPSAVPQVPLPPLSGRPIGNNTRHASVPSLQLQQPPLKCPNAPTVFYNPSSWKAPPQHLEQPLPGLTLPSARGPSMFGSIPTASAFASASEDNLLSAAGHSAAAGLSLNPSLLRAQSCIPAPQQLQQQQLHASAFSRYIRQQYQLSRAASAGVLPTSLVQQPQQAYGQSLQQRHYTQQHVAPTAYLADPPANGAAQFAYPSATFTAPRHHLRQQQLSAQQQQHMGIMAHHSATPATSSKASGGTAPYYALPAQLQAVITAQLRAQGVISVSPMALAQVQARLFRHSRWSSSTCVGTEHIHSCSHVIALFARALLRCGACS